MAVEFGRIEKAKNAFLTYGDDNKPKIVHINKFERVEENNPSGE